MESVVRVDLDLCIGCGICEEQCPVIGANIIYEDEDGNPKVKIDETKCAVCGRCIGTCPQKARYYG